MMHSLVFSQEKFEREYKIKHNDVPASAKNFIQQLSPKKTIWFKEESQIGITIEAKFKWKKQRFSIEFDTLGNVLDVEFIIKEENIPTNTRKKITRSFNEQFSKWKIEKIQTQFLGTPNQLLNAIQKDDTKGIVMRYEIIVCGKTTNIARRFEHTFNTEGETISIAEIIEDNADHLEY